MVVLQKKIPKPHDWVHAHFQSGAAQAKPELAKKVTYSNWLVFKDGISLQNTHFFTNLSLKYNLSSFWSHQIKIVFFYSLNEYITYVKKVIVIFLVYYFKYFLLYTVFWD